MDFNATIDLIIKDLKEASDIIDDLKKYPGVPALQVELAKLKCRSAGECIAILKNLKETSSLVEKEPVFSKKHRRNHLSRKRCRKSLTYRRRCRRNLYVRRGYRFNLIIVNSAGTCHCSRTEEKKRRLHPSETAHPAVVKEPEHKKNTVREQESPILADKFSNLSNTFHDKLGIIKSEDDLSDNA